MDAQFMKIHEMTLSRQIYAVTAEPEIISGQKPTPQPRLPHPKSRS